MFRQHQAPEYDLRKHLEWEEKIRNPPQQQSQGEQPPSGRHHHHHQGAAITGGGSGSGARGRNSLLAEPAGEEALDEVVLEE